VAQDARLAVATVWTDSKWTRLHGSIDAQAKKYDQWLREGIILP
jgi:hypothetical protein